jgi:hypothetical protein
MSDRFPPDYVNSGGFPVSSTNISAVNVLDVGYRGEVRGNEARPIVPHAVGLDLDLNMMSCGLLLGMGQLTPLARDIAESNTREGVEVPPQKRGGYARTAVGAATLAAFRKCRILGTFWPRVTEPRS